MIDPAQSLALPMLAMMLLTCLVWLLLFARRIAYMNDNNVDVEQVQRPADLDALLPPRVQAPAYNLRNLVELPVVFYAICLLLSIYGLVDGFYLTCAWIFVVFRYLHSFIHCTYNRVLHRFGAYAIAAIALWVMVIRVSLAALTGV